MALAKNSVFLSLFLPFLLLLINPADSNCPPSFECGELGSLKFPLTNRPECGLFMMDCSSDHPGIQFGAGGPWYRVLVNISTNQFLILDSDRQNQLSSDVCFALGNVSLPVSPSSTFTVSPNLTVFSCLHQSESTEEIIRGRFENYNRTNCSMSTVYYGNPATSHAPFTNQIPPDCMMFQVPKNPNQNSLVNLSNLVTSEYVIDWNVTEECYSCHHAGGQCLTDTMNQFHCERERGCSTIQVPINSSKDSSDLIDLLSPQYVIEWNVSEDCYNCHHSGGICLTNSMNLFHCETERDKKRVALIAVLASGGGVLVIAGLLCSFIFMYCKKRRNTDYLRSRNLPFDPSSLLGLVMAKTRQEQDIELFLKKHEKLAQRRYKYSDLKKITKSFNENLGKGGYGSVYKGKLSDGRLVAVKVLNESKGNGEEFMNEVASISQTSHVNVVTLLGFSFDGCKRALVYDFMPNGSLEKYIQNNSASSSSAPRCTLGWEKLFEIALGIARGLEYLHQGCNMRILHFDIKPHNILLDKDFSPKISDFGLAKLCPNRSSIVSMMVARGTIGYIAPEVFCSNFGEVSYKSDVYSYGMMVLEIAGEKKRIDRGDVDRTSETYFPEYVYKQLELLGDVERDGIMDEDGRELTKRKLIIVGLWCIQTHPKDRPSMSKVVEMLEGKIESLQVPPKPYLSSPSRFELNFSTTSQST